MKNMARIHQLFRTLITTDLSRTIKLEGTRRNAANMRYRIIFAAFLVIFISTRPSAEAGELFSSDFSFDSGLETNNPSRYFVSGGVFMAETFTNSNEYGTFPVAYVGGDFTLSFDITVLNRTTGDTNVGLFSNSRLTNQSPPGDPTIYVIYGGFEQGVGVRGYGASGTPFDMKPPEELFGPFDLNTLYTNTLAYNATTQIASFHVSSPTDSNFFSGTVLVPGGLPALPHLGVSAVGTWVSSGRQQKVAIDNMSLSDSVVPEPSSLVLLSMGAASLLGYGWRRKRKLAA